MRELVPRLLSALKPGGRVIVKGFHREAIKRSLMGGEWYSTTTNS